MNKETIEHAAKEYVMGNSASYVECFEAGADWRINSVWYETNKEIPIPFRPILVEHDDGRFSVNMVGGYMKSCPLAWVRWAYIDDLLPYGKEEAL